VALDRRDRHRYGGSDTVRAESPERYDRFWPSREEQDGIETLLENREPLL
jgi:hypothetical protein